MLKTPREAIAWLEQYCKDDLDQPVCIFVNKREDVWQDLVEDDDELMHNYPTPKDLPKELVEQILENLFESDGVWDSLRENQRYEWNEWHKAEQKKIEQDKLDKELWDTTTEQEQ